MTVEELRALLQDVDADTPVVISLADGGHVLLQALTMDMDDDVEPSWIQAVRLVPSDPLDMSERVEKRPILT